VLADPTQIHQILINLCTNAAHAMRDKGGLLEVTLTKVALDSVFASRHPEVVPGEYLLLGSRTRGTAFPIHPGSDL